jgi:hypothetical protein
MDEEAVREHALTLCNALVAGDIGVATQDFSSELRHNLGEVIALLPLPANEATIDSVAHSPSGFTVVIRIIGDAQDVLLQTRWKDRDSHPTLVEVSHLGQTATAPAETEGENVDVSEAGG